MFLSPRQLNIYAHDGFGRKPGHTYTSYRVEAISYKAPRILMAGATGSREAARTAYIT